MYWNIMLNPPTAWPDWLIETWDVLKSVKGYCKDMGEMINRNMRCIEICAYKRDSAGDNRLIETWDVLKCCLTTFTNRRNTGLIETWDVLK